MVTGPNDLVTRIPGVAAPYDFCMIEKAASSNVRPAFRDFFSKPLVVLDRLAQKT
jgi:hypothetical protein